jgi:Domain of unknown function (DUF6457)
VSTMDDWTALVVAELGIADLVDGDTRDLVLDMTKDVAHGVARPAAPLTAYLMGLAVGRSGSVAEARALGERLSALAAQWAADHPRRDDDAGDRGPGDRGPRRDAADRGPRRDAGDRGPGRTPRDGG